MTETSLLALDHIGQGLKRTLVGTGDGATTTTVIKQRVDRFLKHTLLVTHNDVGRIEIEQPLQTVVTVNHPTVKIIQVRRSETSAVERHEGPEIRWQHRQHVENHPLGLVARVNEGIKQL